MIDFPGNQQQLHKYLTGNIISFHKTYFSAIFKHVCCLQIIRNGQCKDDKNTKHIQYSTKAWVKNDVFICLNGVK